MQVICGRRYVDLGLIALEVDSVSTFGGGVGKLRMVTGLLLALFYGRRPSRKWPALTSAPPFPILLPLTSDVHIIILP